MKEEEGVNGWMDGWGFGGGFFLFVVHARRKGCKGWRGDCLMRATFVRTLWPFHYQPYEVSCTCDGGRKILRDTVFVWRVPREEKRTLQETGEQIGVLLGNEQDFDTGITLRAWTRIWGGFG